MKKLINWSNHYERSVQESMILILEQIKSEGVSDEVKTRLRLLSDDLNKLNASYHLLELSGHE